MSAMSELHAEIVDAEIVEDDLDTTTLIALLEIHKARQRLGIDKGQQIDMYL